MAIDHFVTLKSPLPEGSAPLWIQRTFQLTLDSLNLPSWHRGLDVHFFRVSFLRPDFSAADTVQYDGMRNPS
jgi:hypothetical protein